MAWRLFTDGSADPHSKVGYGAALLVDDEERSVECLKSEVQLRRFHPTSSSRLELQTLLWALGNLDSTEVEVYTDSQTIVGLSARREKLEASGFRSRSGRLLASADLYRRFYDMVDRLDCSFVKLAGHTAKREKARVEQLFALVDRASREALRSCAECQKK